jgi:Egh16-like virulence factor
LNENMMNASTFIYALLALPLVAAHGKVPVLVGNLGGNGTALGIKGAIIPGTGDNSEVIHPFLSLVCICNVLTLVQTQQDTTVFLSTKIMSDGLGYTDLGGNNKLSYIAKGMALSGNTLPQISSTGGSISGTWHIVTADGAGPVSAILDPTGTGKFSSGIPLTVVTQVPGEDGYYKTAKRSAWETALIAVGLAKRAQNINMDFVSRQQLPLKTLDFR